MSEQGPTEEEYAKHADPSLDVRHGYSFQAPEVSDLIFRWEDRASFNERSANADPLEIATLRRCAKELRDILAQAKDGEEPA